MSPGFFYFPCTARYRSVSSALAYANTLWIVRPSGRKLAYIKPRLQPNRFGRMAVTYEGLNAANKWARGETYSGKLVENITQATARDLLAEAMWRMEQAGLSIVGHVHDEVIGTHGAAEGIAAKGHRGAGRGRREQDLAGCEAEGYRDEEGNDPGGGSGAQHWQSARGRSSKDGPVAAAGRVGTV